MEHLPVFFSSNQYCMCMHVCVHACVCAREGVRWPALLLSLHPRKTGSLSETEAYSFGQAGWRVSPWELPIFASQHWGYRRCPASLWILRFKVMFVKQTYLLTEAYPQPLGQYFNFIITNAESPAFSIYKWYKLEVMLRVILEILS